MSGARKIAAKKSQKNNLHLSERLLFTPNQGANLAKS
ncbi:MAG: hypothetical protein ACJAYR_000477 [Sneathiella sp.]|jgi:hypothetical protein